MELCIIVFLFGLVSAGNYRNDCDLRRIDSIRPEPKCSASGGMCTVAVDCPRGQLAAKGLCPLQQRQGVECCHGISVKETRCRKLGGECFFKADTNCKQSQQANQATDCEYGSVCCILI